ncbi:hypothetical protein N431DRAFT_503056 [Stipitochalara longipes BDJ]|nr:hypothetical protein N431DRAFT_503056 [Stipitochalara longipes BDJ]
MPKDQENQGARQGPISCRFCRSRKLRCSRESPCSNCVSRGIRCEVDHPVGSSPGASSSPDAALLERIRKLEDLLENQNVQQIEKAKQNFASPYTLPPHSHKSDVSSQIGSLDSDIDLLQSIYFDQDQSDKAPSSQLVFKICPIQHIMEAEPYINRNRFPSATTVDPVRCVWLPQYLEARILLEKFIQDIDHVHHIVHMPSLPSILDEVYGCLNQQGHLKPGNRGLFSTYTEANVQTPQWIKAFEDVLAICHRTTCLSIEGIQGISIVCFVLLNIEGFSRRCRFLFHLTLLLARELELHLLDHPSNLRLASSAQTEIGRRVWWHLVATDWLIPSKINGVAQGIYQCHPRHMVVKKPLNLNDEDLVEGTSRVEQPMSQPTTMSYALQRISLAQISRNMLVMDIDTELQVLINNTPPFFSMSTQELITTYQLDPSRAANIAHQGYIFYSLLYAQRCKLHFPHFSRGFMDSTYAPSWDLCLQSARKVIQTQLQLGNTGLIATRFKFLGFLTSVFVATIVVLMDLCHSKPSPQKEKQRGEIADAIRLLEEAKNESETTAKFLDSLMHVLRTASLSVLENHDASSTNNYNDGFTSGEDLSLYFNELAQEFEQGVDVGSFDWNSVFSGFDSVF